MPTRHDLYSTLRRARRRARRWKKRIAARWSARQNQFRVQRRQHSAGPPAPAPATIAVTDLGPVADTLDPRLASIVESVMQEHLSYVGVVGLRTLAQMVLDVEVQGVPGVLIETGAALGGSAIVMAAAKSADRPMRVYDVFGLIPPPGERDGEDVHERYATIASGGSQGLGGETYYGYRSDLMAEVEESFRRHGLPLAENHVELVRGLFEDTLVVDGPVALAHLDGDWYESTMTCLSRISPRLSPGGRLIIDDYDLWSGCRAAVDEYFAGRPGFRFERRGKLHVVRLP